MTRDLPQSEQRDTLELLGVAVVAWLTGMIASGVIAQSVSAAAGWNLRAVSGLGGPVGELAGRSVSLPIERPVPLLAQLLFNTPLWLAFVGAVVVGAQMDPTLAVRLRGEWSGRDMALGVVAGLVSQFGLLAIIYQLLLRWLIDPNTVDDAARSLTDQIRGPFDLVALLFLVGVCAPVFEELFFRGLVYRGFEGLGGPAIAIVGSAFVFGAVHFQLVQFAGLFAFGLVLSWLLAYTGRIGASIWAHITFNVATVVLLGVAAL